MQSIKNGIIRAGHVTGETYAGIAKIDPTNASYMHETTNNVGKSKTKFFFICLERKTN